ncbi:MAG: rhodanese-like domain-containing protein [Gammaproteobacteria bacterium]
MSDDNIKRVTPPEAARVLADDPTAILIDVRSKVEFDYVGHPAGATNVMWKDYPGWQENPAFVDEVRAVLAASGGDQVSRPVLAICRSGARSLAAAKALVAAGYTNLYNVEEGFEGDKDGAGHRRTVSGWLAHGLPWEQT